MKQLPVRVSISLDADKGGLNISIQIHIASKFGEVLPAKRKGR